MLSLAASALVANRKLLIYFNPNDLSGTAFGCQNADCRTILGIELF